MGRGGDSFKFFKEETKAIHRHGFRNTMRKGEDGEHPKDWGMKPGEKGDNRLSILKRKLAGKPWRSKS